MLLSGSWLSFIFRNYAWTRFPQPTEVAFISGFLTFFDQFESLAGIQVPFFPGKSLNAKRLALLESADTVGMAKLKFEEALQWIEPNRKVLSKLSDLDIWFGDYNFQDECVGQFNWFQTEFGPSLTTLVHLKLSFYPE